jgi:hypothetical protein
MPSRVSTAPFCAPRSEAAIAVYPASASSSIGVGTAGLFEVAMTAPGADRTNGIACAVVLPDPGAMNATIVSRQLA